MNNKNNLKSKIIKEILIENKTNYTLLSKQLCVSKRTIASCLDEIEKEVENYSCKLIRRQNQGVFLDGKLENIGIYIHSLDATSSVQREDRIFYVYFKLLTTSTYIKLQDVADELYVSLATLSKDMKMVNKLIEENDVYLIKNRNGIRIDISETKRRELISSLINHCWGKPSYQYVYDEVATRKIELPDNIKQMFDKNTVDKIVSLLSNFCTSQNIEVTEYEFQSLVVHLVIALQRVSVGGHLEMDNEQYEILDNTRKLIELLEVSFDISLPPHERYYINVHMLAIEKTVQRYDMLLRDQHCIELQNLICDALGDIHDQSIIEGLLIHLKSAIRRLSLGLSIRNPFYEEIKLNFPLAFEQSLVVRQLILQNYDIDMNGEECAFVALHIQSHYEKVKLNSQKIRAVIVCSSGIGTSRLLEQKIYRNFNDVIEIVDVTSLSNLNLDVLDVDIVISTVKIKLKINVPVVLVNPFLNDMDIKTINAMIGKLSIKKPSSKQFYNLLDQTLIWVNHTVTTKEEVIKEIGNRLIAEGYAKPGVVKSAFAREQLASTAHNNMAIPHAAIEYIVNSKICVYINKDGIKWNEENDNVQVVFFIAINEDIKGELNDIYEYFNEIIGDEKFISKLEYAKNANEVLDLLRKGN